MKGTLEVLSAGGGGGGDGGGEIRDWRQREVVRGCCRMWDGVTVWSHGEALGRGSLARARINNAGGSLGTGERRVLFFFCKIPQCEFAAVCLLQTLRMRREKQAPLFRAPLTRSLTYPEYLPTCFRPGGAQRQPPIHTLIPEPD